VDYVRLQENPSRSRPRASERDELFSAGTGLFFAHNCLTPTTPSICRDNGAPVQVGGSNGPQRGGKGSNWEGGVHEPAVWGGGLIPPARRGAELPRASAGAFAIADAHATFLARAGLSLVDPNPRAPAPVDGLDVWDWVQGAVPMSPRIAAGLPLDHLNYPFQGRSIVGAYIKGDLKLIVGPPGGEQQASWYGGAPDYFSPNASMPVPPIDATACNQNIAPGGCLFNLTADPNEHEDIAATQPGLFTAMMADFVALNATYHPAYIVRFVAPTPSLPFRSNTKQWGRLSQQHRPTSPRRCRPARKMRRAPSRCCPKTTSQLRRGARSPTHRICECVRGGGGGGGGF
jgi:hypothetical protein